MKEYAISVGEAIYSWYDRVSVYKRREEGLECPTSRKTASLFLQVSSSTQYENSQNELENICEGSRCLQKLNQCFYDVSMMVRPLPTRGFKFQILVENHWSELGRFWAQKHQGNPFRNVKSQRHPYEGVFSLIVFFNRWEIVSGKSVWKSMGTFIARNIFYFEINGFSDHTTLTKGDFTLKFIYFQNIL